MTEAQKLTREFMEASFAMRARVRRALRPDVDNKKAKNELIEAAERFDEVVGRMLKELEGK